MLQQSGVRFVVVGGVAENVHGSARVTFDLDIVYDPAPDNRDRLIALLKEWRARLRGGAPDLPFVLDEKTLLINPVLTLDTDHGRLDVMDRIDGIGDYRAVLARSVETAYEGVHLQALELDALIESKRATGRAKDVGPAIELEALREKRRRGGPGAVKEARRRRRRSRRPRRA